MTDAFAQDICRDPSEHQEENHDNVEESAESWNEEQADDESENDKNDT